MSGYSLTLLEGSCRACPGPVPVSPQDLCSRAERKWVFCQHFKFLGFVASHSFGFHIPKICYNFLKCEAFQREIKFMNFSALFN